MSPSESLYFSRGIPDGHPNDYHQGILPCSRLDTQEAIDFFTRGLIHAPFKVGKLSELTQVFQLMEEGKLLDTMFLIQA